MDNLQNISRLQWKTLIRSMIADELIIQKVNCMYDVFAIVSKYSCKLSSTWEDNNDFT